MDLNSALDAKNEYEELSKELSRKSHRTSASKAEQGQADQEDFDLSEFLRGMHREEQQNGHKRKNLGVSWKDLRVEVRLFFLKKKRNAKIPMQL